MSICGLVRGMDDPFHPSLWIDDYLKRGRGESLSKILLSKSLNTATFLYLSNFFLFRLIFESPVLISREDTFYY